MWLKDDDIPPVPERRERKIEKENESDEVKITPDTREENHDESEQ